MVNRQSPAERARIRSRRMMIYTFLLILVLFYASAHIELEKERTMAKVEAAGGAGAAGMTGMTDSDGQLLADGQEYVLAIQPEDMWSLILTNAEYPVPEDYEVELRQLPGTDQSVDARIYNSLCLMMEDMKAANLSPVVCSGYRTLDKQEKLFNRKVKSYVKQGNAWEKSYELARQTISIPGSGEHCLGLAVDFYTATYHQLEREFENTPESVWLQEHAQDYGFIMRYQEGKEDITGIHYEPWHYRYVGVEVARYMKAHNLTLEEFYIDQSLYGRNAQKLYIIFVHFLGEV